MEGIASIDLFVVPTIAFEQARKRVALRTFDLALREERRRSVTEHSENIKASGGTQVVRNACLSH
jgi:hypothetical protein